MYFNEWVEEKKKYNVCNQTVFKKCGHDNDNQFTIPFGLLTLVD